MRMFEETRLDSDTSVDQGLIDGTLLNFSGDTQGLNMAHKV